MTLDELDLLKELMETEGYKVYQRVLTLLVEDFEKKLNKTELTGSNEKTILYQKAQIDGVRKYLSALEIKMKDLKKKDPKRVMA